MRGLLVAVAMLLSACAHGPGAESECAKQVSECQRECAVRDSSRSRQSPYAGGWFPGERSDCERRCRGICLERREPATDAGNPDAGS